MDINAVVEKMLEGIFEALTIQEVEAILIKKKEKMGLKTEMEETDRLKKYYLNSMVRAGIIYPPPESDDIDL
ncbi:MAG: hypothetical protein AAGA43_12020 [Bacteroidota bacterium]